MSVGLIDGNEAVDYVIASGRTAWVQITRGQISLNQNELKAGDGAAISEVCLLQFRQGLDAEIILFDMAAYKS